MFKYIEDITQWQEDLNFMFEWQEQYLTRLLPSLVMFFLLLLLLLLVLLLLVLLLYRYMYTNEGVLNDFLKISEDSPKLVQRSHEHCQTLSEHFQRFLKITQDF